jgi:hypothetical protein
MNRSIFKMKSIVPLLFVAAGFCSLLLSSCASSGGAQASTNAAYYNPNPTLKELTPATFPESRWPFGPGGFR